MDKERWIRNEGRRVETPKINAFLTEIADVCIKHGYSIGHEDAHGGFLINRYNTSNIEWLGYASVDDDVDPEFF